MSLPVLLLLDDPLTDWSLSKQSLIDCYHELVGSKQAHLLGYKGDHGDFITEVGDSISNFKYVNLFSEVRETTGNGISEIYRQVTSHKFTHDFLISSIDHPVLSKMSNELGKIFSVDPNTITFNYIEANVTLLAHKDDDYFIKTKNIPSPMMTMKSKMITDNAMNWILLGNQSELRLLANGKKYTNGGSDKVCFFNPCAYKHGTTLNIHRLILTVRFRSLKFEEMLPTVYKRFGIEDVQPI